MKICSKCKRDLPLGAFTKDRSKRDGLHSGCKECNGKRGNKYRATRGKEVYRAWITQGMCTRGDKRPLASRTCCQVCLDSVKERNKRNIANGKCRRHPGRDIDPRCKGKYSCTECLDRQVRRDTEGAYQTLQEKYDDWLKQDKKCLYCGGEIVDWQQANADHDHVTKKKRGLLHGICNTGLGTYEANKQLAEVYLKRFSPKRIPMTTPHGIVYLSI